MGVYTTVATVRAEPEVPDAAPPDDATLESTIATAEDLIDGWLGGWPIQTTGPSNGRKIVQADVEPYSWVLLGRAATRLAARLWENPRLLDGPTWSSVRGPDFAKAGPAPTLRKILDVAAPLNASGLRALAGRARA